MEKQVAFVIQEAGFFDLNADEERRVSVLTNAIYFFLGSAFIINSGGDYRLVVMHNGRLLVDEVYHSLKGSKIAFYRFCQDRLWKQGVKPCWSDFFNPDKASPDKTDKNYALMANHPLHHVRYQKRFLKDKVITS